jgi:hypothetical protein
MVATAAAAQQPHAPPTPARRRACRPPAGIAPRFVPGGPGHAAALAAVGLSPECDAGGQWEGDAGGDGDPLADPAHALNGEWRAVAAEALAGWASGPAAWG